MNYQETFQAINNNYTFETQYDYISNSVRAALSTGERVTITELGEKYITIDPDVKDSLVIITYNIETNEDTINTDLLRKRVIDLEKQVQALNDKLNTHEEALNNRVSITTFQTWLKLVEKKAGIKLIDNNLGIVTTELTKR